MKTIIIAEAGVNHNGSLKIAKKLIKIASKAGANIIKFQTFTAKNTHTLNAKKANYLKKSTKNNQSFYDVIKSLELSKKTSLCMYNNAQLRPDLEAPSPLYNLQKVHPACKKLIQAAGLFMLLLSKAADYFAMLLRVEKSANAE